MRKITVAVAVKEIKEVYKVDMGAVSLMAWMRSGRCPFGTYIRREGSERGRYIIMPERMDNYFKARDLQPPIP